MRHGGPAHPHRGGPCPCPRGRPQSGACRPSSAQIPNAPSVPATGRAAAVHRRPCPLDLAGGSGTAPPSWVAGCGGSRGRAPEARCAPRRPTLLVPPAISTRTRGVDRPARVFSGPDRGRDEHPRGVGLAGLDRACHQRAREGGDSSGRAHSAWAAIREAEGRHLRVVLLPDGETVHNAFFDRSFKP